mmetsp:Transcript_116294/g.163470  ORF Transcript_116294/g.163470 Transcript_116294/m.163470 type:complete len:164 (+) Transcript_116294:92-583(+)
MRAAASRFLLPLILRFVEALPAETPLERVSCSGDDCEAETPLTDVLLLQLGVAPAANASAALPGNASVDLLAVQDTSAAASPSALSESVGRQKLPLDLLWRAMAEVTVERVRRALLICMIMVVAQLFGIMWMSSRQAKNLPCPEPLPRVEPRMYHRAAKQSAS